MDFTLGASMSPFRTPIDSKASLEHLLNDTYAPAHFSHQGGEEDDSFDNIADKVLLCQSPSLALAKKSSNTPLALPNFLIYPQDGQFTPYLEFSPIQSPVEEHSESMLGFHEISTEINSNSPRDTSPETTTRSRSATLVLKKLIDEQARMMNNVSSAWKKKYHLQSEPENSISVDARLSTLNLDSPEDYLEQLSTSNESPENYAVEASLPTSPTDTLDLGPGESRESAFLVPYQPHGSIPNGKNVLSEVVESEKSKIEDDRLSLQNFRKNDSVELNRREINIEGWKKEAEESKAKLEFTLAWIRSLAA